MLKQWIAAERPAEDELKARLEAAKQKRAGQQMQLKDHKVPVLVLVEGWGAAGKGSTIGRIIRNIDPRFFKVATMAAPSEEERRKPFFIPLFCPASGSREVHIAGFGMDGRDHAQPSPWKNGRRRIYRAHR